MAAEKGNLDDFYQELSFDYHKIPLEDLYRRLETNPETGISHETAKKILKRDGENVLLPPKRLQLLKRLFLYIYRHVFNGFTLLLGIAAKLCFVLYFMDENIENLILGVVLVLVNIVTEILRMYQEYKSGNVVKSFEYFVPHFATVVREAEKLIVSASHLVVGDVVELKAGDRIPADIRIIEARDFLVDNSVLTGESYPQPRSSEYTHDNPLATKNLAFFGTIAVEGFAKGVVVGRGGDTIFGRIARLSCEPHIGDSPVSKDLQQMTRCINCIGLISAGVICIVAFLSGVMWLDCIFLVVAIIIANVPVALLIIITICLALTAQRLQSKNISVSSLEAVVTLGSVSVICCDKTGILSQNRMTVTHIWYDDKIVPVETSEEQSGVRYDKTSAGFKALTLIATLCNRAEFKSHQKDVSLLNKETTGDAFDTALLKWVELSLGDATRIHRQYHKVAEIPLNHSDHIQVSIHENSDSKNPRYLLVMKGAADRILERCSTILTNGKEISLSEKGRKTVNKAYMELAGLGERVLGLCDALLPSDNYPLGFKFTTDNVNFPTHNLRFVGLVSMIDPSRADALEAIAKCRLAGIKLIMVTDDHPVTAKAFAKSVGIIPESSETVEDIAQSLDEPVSKLNKGEARSIVVNGSELSSITGDKLDNILRKHDAIVFAQTSPHQKLSIVESCQRSGAFVAVTGAGVNDAPALRKADVGIALSSASFDVPKQVADVILMDDNFASIVTGVEESRLIFDNLRKTIAYTLTHNLPEILLLIGFVLLDMPPPLTAIVAMCIDLGTDVVPAIALAYGAADPHIMNRPPRKTSTDKLVTKRLLCMAYGVGLLETAAAFFAYFLIMDSYGFPPNKVLGLYQVWHHEKTPEGKFMLSSDNERLESTAQTAVFVLIVVVQLANLIVIHTTKPKSLFQQGMRNGAVHFALIFQTALATFLVYTSGLNSAFHLYPIDIIWWLPAVPFALALVAFDEGCRCLARRNPGGWLAQHIYY